MNELGLIFATSFKKQRLYINLLMKIFVIICFLLLPNISSAQEKSPVKYYTSPLEIGDLLIFGDKSVKFKGVISDSRCPKNVTCVWAGEAKVLVEIFENGRFLEEKIISTKSGFVPLNFSVEDLIYGITSINLLPYPTTEANVKPQYTLHINVSEKF